MQNFELLQIDFSSIFVYFGIIKLVVSVGYSLIILLMKYEEVKNQAVGPSTPDPAELESTSNFSFYFFVNFFVMVTDIRAHVCGSMWLSSIVLRALPFIDKEL